jgi:hypothetical protein
MGNTRTEEGLLAGEAALCNIQAVPAYIALLARAESQVG